MKQQPLETISQWYVKIKNKAINCRFGTRLEENLKDKFIAGLQKGSIMDRICEEDHTITLAGIYEVALKKEAALSTISVNKLDVKKNNKLQHQGNVKIPSKPVQQGANKRYYNNDDK